jgi:hypothetical protein
MAGLEQCAGKNKYGSEQLARKIARKRAQTTGQDIHAYQCELCRKWHIGHRIKRMKRRWN